MRDKLCGLPRQNDIGSELVFCGWINSRRDHGGVIFLDLRDHTGLMQIVCEPKQQQAFSLAEQLRPEQVIQVSGSVRARPEQTANKDLPTGEVELVAEKIELLNKAVTPPYQPDDPQVSEDTQLEHRVIHLRSHGMQKNLRIRHRVTRAVREVLDNENFVEVETPMLTRSTPEGARDFLVPARNHPGEFYALPQSPQLFKQVLMAGGIDRYYQFARCFRDEDLRAGRQPEFTQIDLELAFATERDVMEIAEQVVAAAFNASDTASWSKPATMSYSEAISEFGCDAPDLSIDMRLVDIIDEVQDCGFKVFAEPAAAQGSRVVALRAPGGGKLSRKQIDVLTEFVRKLGAGGLAYLKIDEAGKGESGVTSPIAKFLGDETIDKITQKCGAETGDLIFFGAGQKHVVNGYMAPLRTKLGDDLGLRKAGIFPLWLTDFPLFVTDPATGKLLCPHHPFTAPSPESVESLLAGEKLEELRSQAYDLVVNGIELGGGSIRIHQPEVQLAALAALDIDADQAKQQFGFLLNTLSQGAPPHGGIAFGLDRLAAMIVGEDSIRSMIAFPKTQRGQCLFTDAPQRVEQSQLRELGLSLCSRGKEEQAD